MNFSEILENLSKMTLFEGNKKREKRINCGGCALSFPRRDHAFLFSSVDTSVFIRGFPLRPRFGR